MLNNIFQKIFKTQDNAEPENIENSENTQETADGYYNQWFDKHVKQLEAAFESGETLPFIIDEIGSAGFKVRTGGLRGYVYFNKMPWRYSPVYWQTIAPSLRHKKYVCKISKLQRMGTRVSINIDATVTKFDEIVLDEQCEYTGIVLDVTDSGLFIDVGYHFNWRNGSLRGTVSRSQMMPATYDKLNEGDLIRVKYVSADNGEYKFAEAGYYEWYRDLIGTNITAVIQSINDRRILFTFEYNGQPCEASMNKSLAQTDWDEGDEIDCTVTAFVPLSNQFIVKHNAPIALKEQPQDSPEPVVETDVETATEVEPPEAVVETEQDTQPKSVLTKGDSYNGVVTGIDPECIKVDVGCHFNWKHGSLPGIAPRRYVAPLKFDNVLPGEILRLCCIHIGVSETLFAEKEFFKHYADVEGAKVKATVTSVEDGEPVLEFTHDGRLFDGYMSPIAQNVRKQLTEWRVGDEIECTVLSFNPCQNGFLLKSDRQVEVENTLQAEDQTMKHQLIRQELKAIELKNHGVIRSGEKYTGIVVEKRDNGVFATIADSYGKTFGKLRIFVKNSSIAPATLATLSLDDSLTLVCTKADKTGMSFVEETQFREMQTTPTPTPAPTPAVRAVEPPTPVVRAVEPPTSAVQPVEPPTPVARPAEPSPTVETPPVKDVVPKARPAKYVPVEVQAANLAERLSRLKKDEEYDGKVFLVRKNDLMVSIGDGMDAVSGTVSRLYLFPNTMQRCRRGDDMRVRCLEITDNQLYLAEASFYNWQLNLPNSTVKVCVRHGANGAYLFSFDYQGNQFAAYMRKIDKRIKSYMPGWRDGEMIDCVVLSFDVHLRMLMVKSLVQVRLENEYHVTSDDYVQPASKATEKYLSPTSNKRQILLEQHKPHIAELVKAGLFDFDTIYAGTVVFISKSEIIVDIGKHFEGRYGSLPGSIPNYYIMPLTALALKEGDSISVRLLEPAFNTLGFVEAEFYDWCIDLPGSEVQGRIAGAQGKHIINLEYNGIKYTACTHKIIDKRVLAAMPNMNAGDKVTCIVLSFDPQSRMFMVKSKIQHEIETRAGITPPKLPKPVEFRNKIEIFTSAAVNFHSTGSDATGHADSAPAVADSGVETADDSLADTDDSLPDADVVLPDTDAVLPEADAVLPDTDDSLPLSIEQKPVWNERKTYRPNKSASADNRSSTPDDDADAVDEKTAEIQGVAFNVTAEYVGVVLFVAKNEALVDIDNYCIAISKVHIVPETFATLQKGDRLTLKCLKITRTRYHLADAALCDLYNSLPGLRAQAQVSANGAGAYKYSVEYGGVVYNACTNRNNPSVDNRLQWRNGELIDCTIVAYHTDMRLLLINSDVQSRIEQELKLTPTDTLRDLGQISKIVQKEYYRPVLQQSTPAKEIFAGQKHETSAEGDYTGTVYAVSSDSVIVTLNNDGALFGIVPAYYILPTTFATLRPGDALTITPLHQSKHWLGFAETAFCNWSAGLAGSKVQVEVANMKNREFQVEYHGTKYAAQMTTVENDTVKSFMPKWNTGEMVDSTVLSFDPETRIFVVKSNVQIALEEQAGIKQESPAAVKLLNRLSVMLAGLADDTTTRKK